MTASPEDLRERLPAAPGYIETPTARRIAAALAYAQMAGDMALVCGGAGRGKTMAARQYSATRPETWLTTATPAARALGPCLNRVAAAGGVRPGGVRDAARTESALLERLAESRGLLIVDEAQHLDNQALEGLRGLHDAAGIGVALLGSTAVDARTAAPDAAQIRSRIGRRVRLGRTPQADVDAILAAWKLNGDADIRAAALSIASRAGALRGLTKALCLAALFSASTSDEAAGDGPKPISARHLRAAQKDLAGGPS